MDKTTTTTTTTTKFSLGFRMLARVEGRRWLSKIKRNASNSAATHHSSASVKQPAPQTSTSQSKVNTDRTFDLPSKEDKTTIIKDAVTFQSTTKDNLPQKEPIQGTHNAHTVVVSDDSDDDEQQKGKNGKKVKNLKGKVYVDRNHIQEEIKDQRKNILEKESENESSGVIDVDLLDDNEDTTKGINEKKRKIPKIELSIETQLKKDQRREILLARLRARIEKSKAMFIEEQMHT